MAASLCGDSIGSRRALLAALWSLVIILTAIAFLTALTFTLSARNLYKNDMNEAYKNYYNNEDQDGGGWEDMDPEVAVTSRAMAFAALWTAVLASLLAVFGTVVLGWQSPTGQYYTCCSSNVHRTTPLSLGSFIGALIMFANLTLVCSVLFGEFEIRDSTKGQRRDGGEEGQQWNDQYNAMDTAMERSSMAFSIMCMFLTVLYAGFAALTFSFSHSIIEEHATDEREEALAAAHHTHQYQTKMTPHHHVGFNSNGYDGYIGERFDVHRSRGAPGVGFVPKGADVSHVSALT